MRFAGKNTLGWKTWILEKNVPKREDLLVLVIEKEFVEKMRLTKMEVDCIPRRMEANLGGSKFLGSGHEYLIVPKYTLPRVEKAPILTAIANMRKFMGMYKNGGLARTHDCMIFIKILYMMVSQDQARKQYKENV